MIQKLLRNRNLIIQLTKREIVSRYKGSYLGLLWSFLIPIILLSIYTFVFSVVFNAKWGENSNSKIEFALLLFSGIIAYNIFAEVISRSPTLIINNSNYVKKVVFPLYVLPLSVLLSVLVNAGINLIILLVTNLIVFHTIHLTVLYLPLVLLPVIIVSIGISLFLSSLGVFIRDLNHLVGLFLQALMFLSPIFYPITNIPKGMRYLFYINPISYVVEDMRRIIVWGESPNWLWLGIGTITSLIVFYFGQLWFRKTKGGFADVI